MVGGRPWPAKLQFEASYRCNLVCQMCPRSFDESLQGMMEEDLFKVIEEDVGNFQWVHVTGWGETLMHKSVPDWVKRIGARGASASFTTNGLLLKPKLRQELYDAKMHSINISIDAATRDTYEKVRGKDTFDLLIRQTKEFGQEQKERRARGEHTMHTQWVFILMRHTFEEFPDAVRLAAELGFDTIVGKHLESHRDRKSLADMAMFPVEGQEWDEELEVRYQAMMQRAHAIGAERGVRVVIHSRKMRGEISGTGCLVDPTENVYVDYKGNVSICCYLNHLDSMPYQDSRPSDHGMLGNIKDAPLREILASDGYGETVDAWRKKSVPKACQGCLQVHRMELGRD